MKTCTIENCSNKHEARGLCNAHYLRWLKYGSPLIGKSRAKNGIGTISKSNGYRIITDKGIQRLEHVVIAEKALGKKLPTGSHVHHINGIKIDNRNKNLVVCKDDAYHKLLHRRQEALLSASNPNARKCRYCDQWDVPENMYLQPGKYTGFHRSCRQIYRRKNQSN